MSRITRPNRGAQEFEFAPRPPELAGVGVASAHDRRLLGQAPVALAQPHIALRSRWHSRASVGWATAFWLHRGVDHHPLELRKLQFGRDYCPGWFL